MNTAFNKFLWKIKIDITEFTEGEEHFLTLREPNTAEMKEIVRAEKLIHKGNSEEDDAEGVIEASEIFAEACCTLIVDHNFYTEDAEPQKLPAKEVSAFLKNKLELVQHVMMQFLTSLPLVKKNATK